MSSIDLPPEPFFSGPGLDRADALRADEAALQALAAGSGALQLKWSEGVPEITAEGRLVWEQSSNPELFLGLDGEAPRFSAIEEPQPSAPAIFPLMAVLDADDAPLFAAAMSLSRWHCRHRFCANCGQLTELVRGGWSRCCPACDAEHYPRVDPVVIMLAVSGERCLLGRGLRRPGARFSCLAGFMEPGETLEEAVRRDLGLDIGH